MAQAGAAFHIVVWYEADDYHSIECIPDQAAAEARILEMEEKGGYIEKIVYGWAVEAVPVEKVTRFALRPIIGEE